MDNLIRSFANTLDYYTKLSMRCWSATPEQCKEMMTMDFPLIQTFQMQHTLEKIGQLPFDSRKAAAEIMEYQRAHTPNSSTTPASKQASAD